MQRWGQMLASEGPTLLQAKEPVPALSSAVVRLRVMP